MAKSSNPLLGIAVLAIGIGLAVMAFNALLSSSRSPSPSAPAQADPGCFTPSDAWVQEWLVKGLTGSSANKIANVRALQTWWRERDGGVYFLVAARMDGPRLTGENYPVWLTTHDVRGNGRIGGLLVPLNEAARAFSYYVEAPSATQRFPSTEPSVRAVLNCVMVAN